MNEAVVTCPDAEEARRAARSVMGERLAARAHVHPAAVGSLIETTRRADPALEARSRALHGHELPAIVARDMPAGSAYPDAGLKHGHRPPPAGAACLGRSHRAGLRG